MLYNTVEPLITHTPSVDRRMYGLWGAMALRKSSKNRHQEIAKLCSNILVLNVSTIKDDYYCRFTVDNEKNQSKTVSFIVQDSSL